MVNSFGKNMKDEYGLMTFTTFEDHDIDIVAVHGLGGGREKTWRHPASNKLWLRDFLPSDILNARVMSFGYNAKTAFTKSVMNIDVVAEALLAATHERRTSTNGTAKPIIFICHSLGGIIVKKALILANERRKEYQSLLMNVRGVVFFAVPHRGSDIAALGKMLANVLKVATLGLRGNPRYVKALEKNSKHLDEISKQFVERLETIQVRTFYETETIKGQLAVDENSARLNITQELTFPLLGTDHVSICKFHAKESQNYTIVLSALRKLVSDATDSPSYTYSEPEEKFLQTLYKSDYDSFKRRNPSRTPGTCDWFLQHDQYRKWFTGKTPGLLWLSADAGCGKSVLSSFLVEELAARTGSVICYFFFKDDNEAQGSAVHALCALLHQLFSVKKALIKYAMDEYRTKGPRLVEQFGPLSKICAAAGKHMECGRVICIMDGLDECQESDRDALMAWLIDHYSPTSPRSGEHEMKMKFIITSRPYPSIERFFRRIPCIRLKGEDEKNLSLVNEDIAQFVKVKIEEIGLDKQLPLQVKGDLRDLLIHRADTTFLWVSLILDEMSRSGETSAGRLKALINSTPNGLDGVYKKMLEKTTDKERMKKLLHIIVAAVQPFTLEQINLALCIGDQMKSYAELDLESNITVAIKTICGPFVKVTNGHVYLVHQTAREFLLKGNSEDSVDLADAHCRLANICMTYMLFSDFKNRSGNLVGDSDNYLNSDYSLEKHCFLTYSGTYWMVHVQEGGALILDKDDIWAKVLELCDTESPWFRVWADILATAKEFTHPKNCSRLLVLSHFGLKDAIKRLLCPGIEIDEMDNLGWTALHWAVWYDMDGVVEMLLKYGATVGVVDKDGWTPLHRAIEMHSTKAVKLLLDAGADVNVGGPEGLTPLHYIREENLVQQLLQHRPTTHVVDKGRPMILQFVAERSEAAVIVQMLLNAGANVKATDAQGCLPLHYAQGGEVIQLLLQHGADVTIVDNFGQTPLHHLVCSRESVEAIKLLLNAGTDVNARNTYGQTPLHGASEREVVQLLLQHGADVNAVDKDGETILHHVLYREKSVEIVKLLLNAGADVKARNTDGKAPLHFVSEIEIAQLLLQHGADVTMVDEDGQTPLHHVVDRNESGEIVNLLLNAGADVKAINGYGETPLHCASGREVVQLLLQHEANVAVVDENGQTPLHHAVNRRESVETVKLLLDAGADVKAKNAYGETPLHRAAVGVVEKYGQPPAYDMVNGEELSETVKLLLNAGADVKARNTYGETPLHCASQREMVQLLLQHEADVTMVDEDGQTPLHCALNRRESVEIIKLLLNAGADAKVRNAYEETPLHCAVGVVHKDGEPYIHYMGNREELVETVKLLLNAGADVKAKDAKRMTPLHYVADTRLVETVQLFLDKGADANARDAKGMTPLHYAASLEPVKDSDPESSSVQRPFVQLPNRSPSVQSTPVLVPRLDAFPLVVELLLAAGADTHTKDLDGFTPLQYALRPTTAEWLEVRQEIIQLLQARGVSS